MEKILLGKVSKGFDNMINGEEIYLSKHSWDCDWYWGLGYVGNNSLHTHFNEVFLKFETNINKIFVETAINQEEWWILRDLFFQAYALKECAEVYHYGGHQITKKGVTDLIKSVKMEKIINKDLEIVLNKIWKIMEGIDKKRRILKNIE